METCLSYKIGYKKIKIICLMWSVKIATHFKNDLKLELNKAAKTHF